jgi:probable F420-dependent oxidoreductase
VTASRGERVDDDRKHDRPSVRIHGRQPRDPRRRYSRVVHFGVILPNYGKDSSPDRIRRVAEAAEELGFDSVWTTEHIVVGPDGVDPYGRVYDPLVTLGWIAGWTEGIGLGTSIVLVPLHNPFHLAKQVATLQEVSGGRLTLGVGIGWHRDEFEFMGVEFEDRGRRADEAIWLMRALWRGERAFGGRYWAFRDATAEPLPSPQPKIWVGGSSARAVRRARELGDAWHPSRGSNADHVRLVKKQHPELRVIPRTSPEQVEAMLEAGAEGAVVAFADETAMRDFARHQR